MSFSFTVTSTNYIFSKVQLEQGSKPRSSAGAKFFAVGASKNEPRFGGEF